MALVQRQPGTEIPRDDRGIPMIAGVSGFMPRPVLDYDAPLIAPAVGEYIELAGVVITCEERRSVTPTEIRYVVRHEGELVAMARSDFRGLCHYRGLQLCPLLLARYPNSWPIEAMSDWQRLRWEHLSPDLPRPVDPYDVDLRRFILPFSWCAKGTPPPQPQPSRMLVVVLPDERSSLPEPDPAPRRTPAPEVAPPPKPKPPKPKPAKKAAKAPAVKPTTPKPERLGQLGLFE